MLQNLIRVGFQEEANVWIPSQRTGNLFRIVPIMPSHVPLTMPHFGCGDKRGAEPCYDDDRPRLVS